MNEELPISEKQALKAHQWLTNNFGSIIAQQTKYSPELVAAIFCQETAQRVQLWFDNYTPDIILARCVFDASGDFPGTSRSAFPKNSEAFREKYGNEFTDMLIEEGRLMRKMPQPGNPNGFSTPGNFLYKGYGIFQLDLQSVSTDEEFFRNKLWYNFSDCFDRFCKEMDSKKALSHNDREMVRRYNGAGQNAENYADNVMQFHSFFA